MRYAVLFALLCAIGFGCSLAQPKSYNEFLRQMDAQFAEVYVNGTVREAEKALRVYLVRLDELKQHPECPKDFKIDFARSRGITEGRLAALHRFLGNTEKADAFAVAALTHLPDAQAKTRKELFAFVKRMDAKHKLKWKEKDTQPEN